MKYESVKKLQGLMHEIQEWCLLPAPKTDKEIEQLGAQARDFQKRLSEIYKEME